MITFPLLGPLTLVRDLLPHPFYPYFFSYLVLGGLKRLKGWKKVEKGGRKKNPQNSHSLATHVGCRASVDLAKMYPSSLEALGALGDALVDPIDEETGEDQKDGSGVYKMTGDNFWLKKIETSMTEAERGT